MILIVGCGFLGSYLAEYISENTTENIVATVHSKKTAMPLKNTVYVRCDITKKEDIKKLKKIICTEKLTVYWFASCHNIDFICENKSFAYNVNINALQYFLTEFNNIEKLFFASTDCVYGENSVFGESFKENDALNPVNEYGRQKIAAESLIKAKGFTVLRYPFMLGKGLGDKKHFYDNICNNLKSNIKTEMIDGMYRCVLSYRQAAELTYMLSCIENLPAVINVCSDSVMSKYQIGLTLARKLGADKKLITKITEAEGQKFFKDRRASCTKMDNSLLKKLTGLEKIIWEEEECCL